MRANVLNFLTKATGAVGLGLVLYDAHNAGKIKASMEEKHHKTEQLTGRYLEEMKMDKPSLLKQEAKHHVFNFFVHENMSEPYNTTKGYGRGFLGMLTQHLLPLGLSLVALLGGKGVVSKFCGAGLLAYGALFLAEEIFGFGKAE